MSNKADLAQALQERFKGQIESCDLSFDQVTLGVAADNLLDVCKALRDEAGFRFEQLIDVCGVDYLDYGVESNPAADAKPWDGPRFAAVYHLLSVSLNQRVRLKVMLDGEPPMVDSVVSLWSSADWFEREAFDLFGIVFNGHPDLRRILTDYGFVGHPFRKDFPISGHVEMRYDPEQARVVYQPVSIEPRVGVTRVIREDFRYQTGDDADSSNEAPNA